jgi:isopropylmalate/homocitrate/citramalate synthase
VHPRHPYAGDLVYTSFSGSHQDAIKKGFARAADPEGTLRIYHTCRSIPRMSAVLTPSSA